MNCQRLKTILAEYLLDELSDKLKRSVENHLLTCSACQKELAELKKTLALFEPLPENKLTPEQQTRFLTEIHQKIRRQVQLRPKRYPARWLLPRLVPTLAIATILVWLVTLRIRSKEDNYTKIATEIFAMPTLSLSGEFVVDYLKANSTMDKGDFSQISSVLTKEIEDYLDSRLELPDLVEGLTQEEKAELVRVINTML